jgi:thiol-disulfide isomerase/thioredoxin
MENQRKPVVYLAIVLMAVVAGYLFYDNFIATDDAEIGIQQGNILLDQTISSVDGTGSVSFSEYRGKVLVIDFMAPWCEPCKDQIPILRAVNSVDGVEVISINIDRNYDMETLIEFGAEEGIQWFFGHNPPSALDFEVAGIPTIIVVDREGLIVHRGYFTTINDFERILLDLID